MTPREIRFAVNGLTGLVAISVAAALASLTWRLAGEAGGQSAVGAAMEAYIAPAPPPDVSGMINLPPFGRAMAAAATVTAPTTLILHGVLMANPESASSALIASGGRESLSYSLGDALGAGMILDGIGVDYVVLRLGEQRMMLYFPGDERATQAGAPSPGTAVQPGAARTDQGVRDIKTLLPPSLTGRVAPAPPAAPVSAQPQPQPQPQRLPPQPQPQPQPQPSG